MPLSIEEMKVKRFEYLKKIWEETEGDEYHFVNMFEVGRQLGFDQAMTQKVYQYLRGEGLIEARAIGGTIGITHAGIVEMEAALSNPNEPTEHFIAVNNIITIGNMVNSNIIQASPDASQENSITITQKEELRSLTEELNALLRSPSICQRDKDEINAQKTTIEAQLASSQPNKSTVRAALASVKRVAEGAASSIIGQTLLDRITDFLQTF